MHRIGIAKIASFRKNLDQFIFLSDFDIHQDRNSTMHFGVEYRYNTKAFLRLGVDDGQFVFGAGVKYSRFQIDYASSQIGDPTFFQRSHRITILAFLGKSLTEQASRLESEKIQEINRRTSQQMREEKERRINESLTSGKKYLGEGDYFNARLEFSRVLREDNSHSEARQLLEQTTQEELAVQKAREQELLDQEI